MQPTSTETVGPAFVLASILSAYPNDDFSQNIRLLLEDENIAMLPDTNAAVFEPIRHKIEALLQDEPSIDDLRSEYIDLFDRGRQVNSLYETEYGRNRALVKGNELIDIAGFYHAFGLETGGDGVQADMVDHISVELEFYAILLLKHEYLLQENDQEGADIVLDARKKFLKHHLSRFIDALCERPGIAGSDFYAPAFHFCRALISEECNRLGVDIEPEQWLADQHTETSDMQCGGTVGCLK